MTCWIELFEIELFDHLTVCKHMTDVWLNCLWYIGILGNHLIESKKMCLSSFENVINKQYLQIIYI